MNFFKKIGQALAHFFVGIFDALKKAYLNLDPEQQQALQYGTGFVNLINLMINDAPDQVRYALQNRYPDLPIEEIEKGIFKLAQTFGLTTVTSLEDGIKHIQDYLKSRESKTAWSEASHIGAVAVAVVFAPKEMKFQIITLLIEWVYQHFFKK